MIIGSHDAKQKICPVFFNRNSGARGSCVANGCMAWHWVKPGEANKYNGQGYCALMGKKDD